MFKVFLSALHEDNALKVELEGVNEVAEVVFTTSKEQIIQRIAVGDSITFYFPKEDQ